MIATYSIPRGVWWLVGLYLFVAGLFYLCLANPSLEGDLPIPMYSDALMYETMAKQAVNVNDLVGLSVNQLGPYLILNALDFSHDAIFALNCLLFMVSCAILFRIPQISPLRIFALLAFNPLIFFSLFSLNKEMFSLPLVALMALYWCEGEVHRRFFLIAILLSPLVRWQLTLFTLVAYGLAARWNPLRKLRFMQILALLLLMSIAIPLSAPYTTSLMDTTRVAALFDYAEDRSGAYRFLNDLQMYPLGYAIAFLPKAFHLIYGLPSRMYNLFEWADFWNTFVLTLYATMLGVVLLVVLCSTRFKLRDNLIFMAMVYLVLFTSSPVYAPRYLLPVYILLTIVLSRRTRPPEAKRPELSNASLQGASGEHLKCL